MLSEKLIRPSGHYYWLFLVLTVGLALALALSLVFAGQAEAKKKKKTRHYTKTDTVAQSNFIGPTTASNPLTGPTPYTFANTLKIRSIDKVRVTLTGSATNPTDPGLVLGLDGIDTGIPLNRFGLTPTTATFTAGGTPANASLIRAALRQDGQLVGTVIDRTPGDNTLTIPATSNTTLLIKGVRRR